MSSRLFSSYVSERPAELEPGRACFLLDFADIFFRNVAKPSHLPAPCPAKSEFRSIGGKDFLSQLHTWILYFGVCSSKISTLPNSPLPARGAREMASWASRHFDVRESTISKFCFPNRNTLFLEANDDHPNLKANYFQSHSEITQQQHRRGQSYYTLIKKTLKDEALHRPRHRPRRVVVVVRDRLRPLGPLPPPSSS